MHPCTPGRGIAPIKMSGDVLLDGGLACAHTLVVNAKNKVSTSELPQITLAINLSYPPIGQITPILPGV
jgi:hypothetical protein